MDALTEHFGTTCVAGMKNAVLGMDDRTVELQQEFNALVSQYQQIYGGALVELDGKQLTIPQLGPYKEDLDPAVRRAAYEAEAGYFDAHRDELDTYNKAYRFLKKHGVDLNVDLKALQAEYEQLQTSHAEYTGQLAAVQEELKPLKEIRYWVSKVLAPEQAEVKKKPEPKHSVTEQIQDYREESRKKDEQHRQEKKQNMEL